MTYDREPLRTPYLLGQAAALRGEPLDACRYRRADRRNAWVRGWHEGDDLRLQRHFLGRVGFGKAMKVMALLNPMTYDREPLRTPYLLGQAAALRGEPLDACRYRRADRRNAWVRGWHEGEDQALRLTVFRGARRATQAANDVVTRPARLGVSIPASAGHPKSCDRRGPAIPSRGSASG